MFRKEAPFPSELSTFVEASPVEAADYPLGCLSNIPSDCLAALQNRALLVQAIIGLV